MRLIRCDDCEGQRRRFGVTCASCDGTGRVLDRSATKALVEHVPSETLDVLLEHRSELVAWLVEVEVLYPTRWREEAVPRDVTKASWEPGYRAPATRVVECGLDELGRLFTVAGR